jgi:hypothetical protein
MSLKAALGSTLLRILAKGPLLKSPEGRLATALQLVQVFSYLLSSSGSTGM